LGARILKAKTLAKLLSTIPMILGIILIAIYIKAYSRLPSLIAYFGVMLLIVGFLWLLLFLYLRGGRY
jgi:hypothetical protein